MNNCPSSLILIQFSHARPEPPKEHEILMNEHVRMRTLQRAHDKDVQHQQWKDEVPLKFSNSKEITFSFRKNESRFSSINMEKKKIIKMSNMLILQLKPKNGSLNLIKKNSIIIFLALFDGNVTLYFMLICCPCSSIFKRYARIPH